MTIEHINGIYYRNNRTEYSYGGERFQKIDKDAPEAVQRKLRISVLDGFTAGSGSVSVSFSYTFPIDQPKPDVTYGAYARVPVTPKPLAPNEWRDRQGKVHSFQWANGGAFSERTEFPHSREYYRHDPPRIEDNEVRKALIAWASKPENLPHDVAIVNGIPYLMKDDEARTSWGVVSRIADDWKSFPLDHYDWSPGQRERVEKWRASQPKPLADDEVSYAGRRMRLVGSWMYSNPNVVLVKSDIGSMFDLRDNISSLNGQSLTNARNYAKKRLKLAPDEYLCEESWTVKKRERWVLNYTTTREFLGRPTRVRITETEIFPGEE